MLQDFSTKLYWLGMSALKFFFLHVERQNVQNDVITFVREMSVKKSRAEQKPQVLNRLKPV